MKKSRSVSKKLKSKVVVAEDKLHEISKNLHQTKRKINKLTSKLLKSNVRKKILLKQTNVEKDALAQQMQALYTSGKQSHLRLLLKQDDPSDISRTIKYFEYLNDHRLKRIRSIKASLKKIEDIQVKISADSTELNSLQEEQSKKKLALGKAVDEKEKALKKQRRVVSSQEKKLSKLINQEVRLQGVIQNLQRKRNQEEKKRQENKSKAEKLKLQAKLKNKKSQQANNNKKKEKQKKVLAKSRYVPNKAFSALKGKLSWPVRGRITQQYGATRNRKQAWKGVIISASAGSNVYAVARGKVEFSGRLKGYGYLVIIRHDNNYRSLYAYNRSVYKKKGQIVKGGEIIAAVGNTGGRKNSGLYFEIRRGTKHQNPAHWCK
ncbi:MAG: peptidoglycan DD-metalloendopeptidase family protein [Cocleimonas sp.]